LVKKKKKKQNWLDYYQLKYDRNQSQRPLKKVLLKIQSDIS
jgi:lysine-specific demethylase 3